MRRALPAAMPARADETDDLATDIVKQAGSGTRLGLALAGARQTIVAQFAARNGRTAAGAGAVFDQVILRRVVRRPPGATVDISDLRAPGTCNRRPTGRHVPQRQPQVAAEAAQVMRAGRIMRDNAVQLDQGGVDL